MELNQNLNVIYNEDCFETMKRFSDNQIDIVLTSPFYNTNKKQRGGQTLSNTNVKGYSYLRYDTHVDDMSDEEYNDFTIRLFNEFDRVLKNNGVVLYNLSYGNNNRDGMFKAIYSIITSTDFTIADVITWKKTTALPNNCSPNKLTRITEYVFVLCRKEEVNTFYCNKKVVSVRKSGQKSYGNIFNFIEAKNNDGACPFNKATYSSDLCRQLLNIYAPTNAVVYDPFMGSGTTAVACKQLNLYYLGSEISKNQVEFSNNRISKCDKEMIT